MTRSFAGKRVLVTGAGSGLGQATALRFCQSGWQVAVTDIDPTRAEQTLAQLSSQNCFAVALDVRNQEDFDRASSRVAESWGGLDVLVNNAGVAAAVSVAAGTDQDWDWMLDINLMGVVRGCRTFLPMMLHQGCGHVVNVSSFAGLACAPGMATYNVAKAGVISLSESLRAETVDCGIGVSVVCPSFFATRLLESVPGENQPFREYVHKVMEKSELSAADVADDIYNAVNRNRFMVIPHSKARQQYRVKRFLPEYYFRKLMEFARRQSEKISQL